MKKKLLAMLLALCMVMGLLPLSAFAADVPAVYLANTGSEDEASTPATVADKTEYFEVTAAYGGLEPVEGEYPAVGVAFPVPDGATEVSVAIADEATAGEIPTFDAGEAGDLVDDAIYDGSGASESAYVYLCDMSDVDAEDIGEDGQEFTYTAWIQLTWSDNEATDSEVSEDPVVYKVTVTATLMPEQAAGIVPKDGSITATPNEEDESTDFSKGGVTVNVPDAAVDSEDGEQLTISIDPVTDIASNEAVGKVTDETIKEAIQASGTKMVEVTITDGEGDEVFGDENALQGKEITISFTGLTGGTTYYVFCIKEDGTVTSYGHVTVGESDSSLSFKTRHLSLFAAVPEPEEDADDFVAAVATLEAGGGKESTIVEGGAFAATLESDGSTDTGVEGLVEITIDGASGYFYTLTFGAENFITIRAGSDGKVVFTAMEGSAVSVIETTTKLEYATGEDGLIGVDSSKVTVTSSLIGRVTSNGIVSAT